MFFMTVTKDLRVFRTSEIHDVLRFPMLFSIVFWACNFGWIWHGSWSHLGDSLGMISQHVLVSFFGRILDDAFSQSGQNNS